MQLSEERTALTATAETLKADVDFTKQQLNSVRGGCAERGGREGLREGGEEGRRG